MTDQGFGRRDFLKTAVAGGAAAAATATVIPAPSAQAQQPAAQPAAEGYEFLNLDEAAFVEALVDHMVPADELTPKGTEIGINIYIDRALDVDVDADLGALGSELVGWHHVIDQRLDESRLVK